MKKKKAKSGKPGNAGNRNAENRSSENRNAENRNAGNVDARSRNTGNLRTESKNIKPEKERDFSEEYDIFEAEDFDKTVIPDRKLKKKRKRTSEKNDFLSDFTIGFDESAYTVREEDEIKKYGNFPGNNVKRENKIVFGNDAYRQRGGERRLHMKFARSAVSDFENNVILENRCAGFLPMHAVRNGQDIDIYYKMTGFVPLKTYAANSLRDEESLLRLVSESLMCIRSCEEYLIFPEYISFRAEHMFISEADNSPRFVYMPGFRTTRSMRDLLLKFIDDVDSAARIPHTGSLIKSFRNQLQSEECGIYGYINLADETVRRYQSFSYGGQGLRDDILLKESEENDEFYDGKTDSFMSVKERFLDFVDNILS